MAQRESGCAGLLPLRLLRRVGGWRGSQLILGFLVPCGRPVVRPFPSAPLQTVLAIFKAHGFPVISTDRFGLPCRISGMDRLVAGPADYEGLPFLPLSWMMARVVSALCMSHTSTPLSSDHLSHFAMCPAFPDSDYYWDSVTMGLAPFRQS
jgi:hypothetical protein